MSEQIYVGLDMGSSRCQQAVIGGDGTLRFSRVVPTSEQHLRSAFTGLGGEASMHFEAGELSASAIERLIETDKRTGKRIAPKKMNTWRVPASL